MGISVLLALIPSFLYPPAPPEVSEAPPPEEQPAVIAQNSPPPAPEAQPAPEPKEEPIPQQLPKTASPYPLIGLGGLFSLGLYGLLRLKRLA